MSFHSNAKSDYCGCYDWKGAQGAADKLQLQETSLLRDFICHRPLREAGRRKGRRKKRKRRRCRGRSHYQEMAQTHEEKTKNALRDFGWVASNAIFFPFKGQVQYFPIFSELQFIRIILKLKLFLLSLSHGDLFGRTGHSTTCHHLRSWHDISKDQVLFSVTSYCES